MIISITSPDKDKSRQYGYSDQKMKVIVGRNPKLSSDQKMQGLIIDEPSASRSHLAIKINGKKLKLMDLQSSNGTKINDKPIASNQWVKLQFNDKISIGESECIITVKPRTTLQNKQQQSSQSQSNSRSRQKKQIKSFQKLCEQLKISKSTLKLLKQMTNNKQSKQQKIRFLKLMGCKNVQAHWEQIDSYIIKQNKFIGLNSKNKANQQLQKQFDGGRSGFEKKGLGRK